MRVLLALSLALTIAACGDTEETDASSPASDVTSEVAGDTASGDVLVTDTVSALDTTADSSVPDASMPDASVPDASEADVAVADGASQDTKAGDAVTPDVMEPDAAVSDATASDTTEMDVMTPDGGANDVMEEDVVLADTSDVVLADTSDVASPSDAVTPEGCTPESDGAVCDDSDPCTMNDACSAGVCTGAPSDLDQDGYVDQACGGQDCDDLEMTVFPGAIEVCDGQKNDCASGSMFGEQIWESDDLTVVCAYCSFKVFTCEPGTVLDYYQSCWPNEEPYTELCGDQVDNNCDGEADEGC